MSSPKRRVYLHIGAPKTGTTYLQRRLGANARSLAGHGVYVPGRGPFVRPDIFHFRAALDLLEQDWGGPPGHATGNWEALVQRVRRHSGSVVISHEILAPASADKIAKAKRELAAGGAEIHIVYSARDLARQLPAAWQESIKQGQSWRFGRFLKDYREGRPFFAQAFDLPAVLNSWSAGLAPEQVHVVTVPQRGAVTAPGDDLWGRYCRAFGIDPSWAPRDPEQRNESLGIAETQVLRRINKRMGLTTRREYEHDRLVRELVAQENFVHRESQPVRLGPQHFDWVEQASERWIEWIEASGVDVVGDVDDLRPVRPAEGTRWRNPDKPRYREELDAALEAVLVLTEEAVRRPDPSRRLPGRIKLQAEKLRD
ncbi:hypothetical protein [Nocardioides ochotonae]|uniref:hypothetical protein n=1 Tax=Nocardioides ochotonae TaxID=2685869 RepID=UPI00140AADDC|nr:hypothetical protein [Nocardioides ochotonae]